MGSRPAAPRREKGSGAPFLRRSSRALSCGAPSCPVEATASALAGIRGCCGNLSASSAPLLPSRERRGEPGPAAREQAGGRASERRREAAGARLRPHARARPGGACRAAAAASRPAACVTLRPPGPAPRHGPAPSGPARAPPPRPRPARPTGPAARPRSRPRPPRARDLLPLTAPQQHSPPPAAALAPAPGSRLRAPGSRGAAGPALLAARHRLGREVASRSRQREEAKPVRIS